MDMTLAIGVLLLPVTTEGGYLDDLAAEMDMGKPEPPSDQATITEYLAYLLGCSVRGHIEILGLPAQQEIPYPAPDEIGLITPILQAVEYLERVFADIGARDPVLAAGYNDG